MLSRLAVVTGSRLANAQASDQHFKVTKRAFGGTASQCAASAGEVLLVTRDLHDFDDISFNIHATSGSWMQRDDVFCKKNRKEDRRTAEVIAQLIMSAGWDGQ